MKSYRTLRQRGDFREMIRKSQFISAAMPVESEEEAFVFLRQEKELYPDARHHCWAYILGSDSAMMRYSDDGEPDRCAGLPILDCLRKQGITNAAVVVTRYFGGILLGTGGLTRAYSSGAAGALLAALPAIKTEASTWRFTVDYARFARIETVLSAFPSIRFDSITYTADVSVLVTIPRESEQRLQEELSALTDGQVTPKEYSRQFVMF